MASLILAFLFLWFFFDFHVALGPGLAGWVIFAGGATRRPEPLHGLSVLLPRLDAGPLHHGPSRDPQIRRPPRRKAVRLPGDAHHRYGARGHEACRAVGG